MFLSFLLVFYLFDLIDFNLSYFKYYFSALTDVAFTKKKKIFTQILLVNFTNNYKDTVRC